MLPRSGKKTQEMKERCRGLIAAHFHSSLASPSLTSISCSQAVPGLNAPRGIVRARRPLRRLSRRRRRGARYSLSHSADTVSERARRGANFDVKLHHNNGSQHVLRDGGGGGSRAITERGLPAEGRRAGPGPLFVCHTVQFFLLRPSPLLCSVPQCLLPSLSLSLSLMPLPGTQVIWATGCVV